MGWRRALRPKSGPRDEPRHAGRRRFRSVARENGGGMDRGARCKRHPVRPHQLGVAGALRSAHRRARDGAHRASPYGRRSEDAGRTVSLERHARFGAPRPADARPAYRAGAARCAQPFRCAHRRAARGEGHMITGLSHVSIVVPDLDAAAARLKTVYGLSIGEVKVNEEQGVRLAYAELGNARIELMEPSRPGSPVARFLERNPQGGIHHFALSVDSVDGTVRAIPAAGVRAVAEGKGPPYVHGE